MTAAPSVNNATVKNLTEHLDVTRDLEDHDLSMLSEEEEDDESSDEEERVLIRAKWMFDDCSSIDAMVRRLEEYAEWLRKQQAEGWELRDSVHDDYGFLHRTL